MNNRMLLLLGKILITSTLLVSASTIWLIGPDVNVWPAFTNDVISILIGVALCIYASRNTTNKEGEQAGLDDTIIKPFFQIIKWSAIVAIGFQVIAAIIIGFFYCLKLEFEATLGGCVLVGFVIVWTIKGIEYFKNYKD